MRPLGLVGTFSPIFQPTLRKVSSESSALKPPEEIAVLASSAGSDTATISRFSVWPVDAVLLSVIDQGAAATLPPMQKGPICCAGRYRFSGMATVCTIPLV